MTVSRSGLAAARPLPLWDGSEVLVRQIRPTDKDLIARAYGRLSEASRRQRFLSAPARLTGEDLQYLTEVDHRRHEALVGLTPDEREVVGVARYVQVPGQPEAAEVAVEVAEAWRERGLATELLIRLTERARGAGIRRYTALVAPDNDVVISVLERIGARRRSTTPEAIEFAVDVPAEGVSKSLRAMLRAVAQGELSDSKERPAWVRPGAGRS